MILRLGTGSLAAARKGHSRARHFGTTFTFLVQIFLACDAQHNICTQCFIWEVGSAAASVQARVTRVLASCAFESPDGTILLGISAASSSFGAFSCTTAPLLSLLLSPSLLSPPRAVSSGCSHAVALRTAEAVC